ncbi:MAG: ribulokinase [Tannerellaceae bacterium]|jgi:L-ribulokinase|nr:ribulokinase [Tannerellaceae bacterium]
MSYVIGLDYGTDSCRAVVVDTAGGNEIASAVCSYPRWSRGLYCDPQKNQYRQHPADYIEVMERAIREALDECPAGVPEHIAGISFDTTGSTPALTDRDGLPLALRPELAENPNAMFVLWKDHTAVKEAAEINALAKSRPVDYTVYEGGIYSSEWVWAKMLHVLRKDSKVREKAYAWIEHCDWMPALLTGNTRPETLRRSRCAAGHKALWHDSWGGLPPNDFFKALDPLLDGFRDHLYTETFPVNTPAGCLTEEWARRLGLSTKVVVGTGAFDCHIGAIGAEIRPGAFVRVIGTSTCDIMVVPYEEMGDRLIPGICGQVDGSVIPGMVGLEAGQSGFGDIYAWFRKILEWPLRRIAAAGHLIDEATRRRLTDDTVEQIIPVLSEEAARIPAGSHSIVATDWMNGRRTPDANQLLKGSITGLTLGSTAPAIFRALVEATAFGSKAIVDRFIEHGIEIREVIGIGGISLKSPFVMQTLADVLGMPIKVARTEQACAFGAAMCAAVAAGIYPTVEEAQKAMGQGFAFEYVPNPAHHKLYMNLYERYRAIGAFTESQDVSSANNHNT